MLRQLIPIGIVVCTLAATTAAVAKSQTPLSITSFPTGLEPRGMALIGVPRAGITMPLYTVPFAVIANSGDNSISVLTLETFAEDTFTLTPSVVVTGIPSPYNVAACPVDSSGLNDYYVGIVLVSSPSDNSVRVLRLSWSGFSGSVDRVPTGPMPYAVACFGEHQAVVSNAGDNSLTVIDPSTLTITATIPGVPASKGFHGIAGGASGAWVASTDADVVTVVSLNNSTVLTQLAVSRPTAVRKCGDYICVASEGTDSLTAYDPSTLAQVNNQFQTVPDPQDMTFSPLLGNFAISGQDSLFKFDLTSLPGSAIRVATIPGLAVLDDVFFANKPLVPPCCAAVLATSTSTNRVYLIQPAPDFIRDFYVSNGASFDQTRVAPGLLASIFVATGVTQAVNASVFGGSLPTMLGGVTLRVGGSLDFDTPSNQWIYSPTDSVLAPLHYVGPSQVNFQVPPGIAPGDEVPVQLTKPDGSTMPSTVRITATAPGIFTVLQNGQGQGAVLNDDWSQNGLSQLIVGARPARRGEVIAIFATGGGETTPPLLPGEPASATGDPLVYTNVQPTVTIGGINAPVKFSGAAPGWVGLWQINAEVPADVTPGSAVPLVVTSDHVKSNTVTIAVE